MTHRPRYYRLDADHNPVPVDTTLAGFDEAALLAWAAEVWGDDEKGRRVAFTEVAPGVEVSTVFLGIDHNHWGDGPPVLFETMLFDDYSDGNAWRWSTWAEAEAGHAHVVAAVRQMQTLTPEMRQQLAALRALPDDQIDTSDIPEVTDFSGFKRRKQKVD